MRIVAHVDMDAFYAAIEERDTPRFQGLPLAVGADPEEGKGRGVLTTANYKARAYGLRSAMPISKAWQLSEAAKRRGQPPVVFVSNDMPRYREVSERIMAILRRFVPSMEEVGIDEAFLDLSHLQSFDDALALCREIKTTIHVEQHLTASIGVGPNKLLAKIASDRHKPDGLTIVREEEVQAFLDPLAIRKIPGIGPKTEAAFAREEIYLIRDLKRLSRHELQERLGKRGLEVYERARGQDDSPVEAVFTVKSISEQETFGDDSLDSTFLLERLKSMCHSLIERLSAQGLCTFRTVTLVVRFADFKTVSRAHTLPVPVGSREDLELETLKLLLPFLDSRENPGHKLIRLLGVRIEKFQTRDESEVA
jgi:DNA polymerase IV (archaeal DinB-like DNA polymerase)